MFLVFFRLLNTNNSITSVILKMSLGILYEEDIFEAELQRPI